jgi:hypothetical protein
VFSSRPTVSPVGGIVEKDFDGRDEQVTPYRGMGVGPPGEQPAAENELKLLRVTVGADIGREETAVKGPQRLVAQVLLGPRPPLPLESAERLADRR